MGYSHLHNNWAVCDALNVTSKDLNMGFGDVLILQDPTKNHLLVKYYY